MRLRHTTLARCAIWLFVGFALLFWLRHTPLPQKVPGLLALGPAGYLQAFAQYDPLQQLGARAGLPLAALYRVALLAVLALLFLVYFRALRIARRDPSAGSLAALLAGVALFGLPLLFLPYILSRDVYSYIVYGRMAAVYGAEPALTPPNAFPADPYFQYLVSWKDTPSVYGPLWTLVSHGVTLLVERAGGGVWLYVLAYKLVALAAHAGAAALVWGTLGRWKPEQQLFGTLLYAWNPVALIEFTGSGHNDVLLVFLVLLALYCARREWWRGAVAALAAAALVKWIALLLLPLAAALWLRRQPTWRARALVAAEIAAIAVAVAVLAQLPYGQVARALAAPLATQSTMKAENTLGALAIGGGREVLERLGDAGAARPEWRRAADATLAMLGKLVVLAGWLVAIYAVWRRPTFTRLLEAGCWLLLTMLLVAPVFRVWYVTWPLALAALLGWRQVARIVLAFSAAAPLIYLHWGTHGWSDALVYLPVLALLARYLWRERQGHRARVLALWPFPTRSVGSRL